MNRKQHIAPPCTVRFRRWSRKGYAAFASLGQCVTIGQVRKSITERALTKQVAPGITRPTEQVENSRDDHDTPTMPITAIETLLAALSLQIAAAHPAPCSYTLYNSINRGIDALNASCNFDLSLKRRIISKVTRCIQCVYTHIIHRE